ncbi:MAG: exodeoxyribonuclease III [Opitutales bacterium]|nr:exodeoxyribonuclease III [Opitutales bacterium]
MHLVSWNVNGLRAVLKSTLPDFLAQTNADIYCFQEIKAMPEQVDVEGFPPAGYHAVWNPAQKKGYSGTLVLSKEKPISVTLGLGYEEHDTEGRVITCEFEDFYLVNVYTPNAKNDLSRLAYRHDTWDKLFLEHMQKLQARKPVAVCGDLNVAHREIDLARPKENVGSAGFTPEEREGFDNFVNAGFIDSFRHLHPDEGGHYTWWSFRANARERNVGWRIDYWLISPALLPRVQEASIMPQTTGSDHCPVVLKLA